MEIDHTEGLIAPPPTPMRGDFSVDPDAVDRLAEALASAGIRGAFVCGTTGESMSLSVEERMAVAERWVDVAPEEFAVIVHVGHTSLAEARTLSAHARDVGADAVAAMPPSFFQPASVEDLVDFCARVAAAAPELPFYYYHIPSLTGVRFLMIDFFEAAADRIPSLAGMKFTFEDLMDYGRCLTFRDGRYDVLFGREEMLLSALVLGARGAVGTTFNLAAPLYLRIMASFARGDLDSARADQHRAEQLAGVLRRFGGIPAAKAAMGMIGLDCGPVRPPLQPLSEEALSACRSELEEVGFFDYCVGS